AEWLRRNAPDGAAILSEEVPLPLPTPESIEQMEALAAQGIIPEKRLRTFLGEGRSFHLVPLPPPLPDPHDAILYYDPNLAARFPYLVLRDLPDEDDPGDVPARSRRLFQEYFRRAYEPRGRFGERMAAEEPLSIYRRGDGFELDREALGAIARILTVDETRIRREESVLFTDWAMQAGVALLRGGNAEGARAYLGMAAERDPDRVEARYQYARALTLLGDLDGAKRELSAGMASDPYHGGIHLHLGALLEQEGDTEGALTEYRAAVVQLDDPTPARARLGMLLHQLGRTGEAREQLAELRATAPGADVTRRLEGLLGAP
ncbi:tetratricopeptide repeat protein, partial [bacterium]|nr:tetratricopeptide repeat protein [bacterium]